MTNEQLFLMTKFGYNEVEITSLPNGIISKQIESLKGEYNNYIQVKQIDTIVSTLNLSTDKSYNISYNDSTKVWQLKEFVRSTKNGKTDKNTSVAYKFIDGSYKFVYNNNSYDCVISNGGSLINCYHDGVKISNASSFTSCAEKVILFHKVQFNNLLTAQQKALIGEVFAEEFIINSEAKSLGLYPSISGTVFFGKLAVKTN